jgi:RNA polymerase sigma factor (sigma-70 family)
MDISRLDKFKRFVEENRIPVCRQIAYGFNLSEDDAKDIYQNSIIVLYNKLDADMPDSLPNFFYGIWYRQALKFVRDHKRTVNCDMTEVSRMGSGRYRVSLNRVNEILRAAHTGRISPQSTMLPDAAFDEKQMKEKVKNALDSMAQRCRQLLRKYYLEGYSWSELAQLFDMKNADSAKSAANRCRRRFEEKYRELEIYVKDK